MPLRLVGFDTLATWSIGAGEDDGRDMGLVMSNVARSRPAPGRRSCWFITLNAGGGETARPKYADLRQRRFKIDFSSTSDEATSGPDGEAGEAQGRRRG